MDETQAQDKFNGFHQLTLYRPMFLSYRNQSLICAANQLTGFYMIGTLVDKGLNRTDAESFHNILNNAS